MNVFRSGSQFVWAPLSDPALVKYNFELKNDGRRRSLDHVLDRTNSVAVEFGGRGPDPAHPVSELIDTTETLYRLTVEEYEQIAGFLDDDRVELIDGYLVKKTVKNPPHVVACARVMAALVRIALARWHTRPGEPVRIAGRTEPEPDVAWARGVIGDYESSHPEPRDIALVVEVADTTVAKGPATQADLWPCRHPALLDR